MKKFLFLFGSLFLFSYGTLACLSEVVFPKSIEVPFGPVLKKDSIPQPDLFNFKNELEQKLTQGPSYDYTNSLAVTLIRLSDPQAARNLLLALEADTPGTYNVAINLGTAYELMGINDSSLFWLQKAVNINPSSHQGSEWMHVMILRHKLARDKSPGYLSGSAIMLDFGARDLPENPYSMNVAKVKEQLAYQLRERLSFTTEPDTLMGMLLFDFANLLALSEDISKAIWYYEAAQRFGFNSDLLEARLERMKDLEEDGVTSVSGQEPAELKTPVKVNVYLIATILAILAAWGVWLLIRKGKNNR